MRCKFETTNFAGVAQSVVQLIRNQQVVCSSHITSSNPIDKMGFFFSNPRDRVIRNLPFGQCCIRSTRRSRSSVQSHITRFYRICLFAAIICPSKAEEDPLPSSIRQIGI